MSKKKKAVVEEIQQEEKGENLGDIIREEMEMAAESPTPEEVVVEEPKEVLCPKDACPELLDAWSKGIRGCYDGNSDWCIQCANDFPETCEVCKTGTTGKAARREAKKAGEAKARVKAGQKGEKLIYLENLISEGIYTRDQIIDMYVERWGGSRLSPATQLSDGKNPKHLGTGYNRFGKLIVQTGNLLGFAE